MMQLGIIVLAAGHGSRMKTSLPKVLHPLAHRPMLDYVLETGAALHPAHMICIANPVVAEYLKATHPTVQSLIQDPLDGTGGAVRLAMTAMPASVTHVMVLLGDVPLVLSETLEASLKALERSPMSVVPLMVYGPSSFGRLELSGKNQCLKIIEASEDSYDRNQPGPYSCNSGLMAFQATFLRENLQKLKAHLSHTGEPEYYLTDLVEMAEGRAVVSESTEESQGHLLWGVNTMQDLRAVESMLSDRLCRQAMDRGVRLMHPATTILAHDTVLAPDVVVHPFVTFGPGVVVESGAEILSFCHIEHAHIKAGARVGPFAHLRGGVTMAEGAEVGNFVELKKTQMGRGAKAKHLSYLGDATIGAGANIGAGTITCNYDGFAKHQTVVQDNAFIGAHTTLVAPVQVGAEAMIGAGSVITQNVAAGDLGLARAPQVAKAGWSRAFRSKRKKG